MWWNQRRKETRSPTKIQSLAKTFKIKIPGENNLPGEKYNLLNKIKPTKTKIEDLLNKEAIETKSSEH
ncbi:hypothetical protein HYD89_03800 [Mycoplasmopsis bovis]|nr:hypothetical protein [Mycoplasmopsis bovis]QQH36269.1 hypothetical protein HYD89_03800 [Mycoplasmopsis bovis]